MSRPQLGPIKFQVAKAAGTAVSASFTTPAAALTLMTTVQQFWKLQVFNSCNQAIALAFNGVEALRIGTTSPTLDLSTNGIYLPAGTIISAYNLGTAPTTGEISITALGRDMVNFG